MHATAVSTCEPPPTAATDVCCPEPAGTSFTYRNWPFLCGTLATPAGAIPQLTTTLTLADHLGHWQMRWGLGRMRYRVAPGLYAVGMPGADSPVLVTANYKLTVDVLRRELAAQRVWLLVLDTRGINVWCAAGKGTFGTDEVVRQVEASRLTDVVAHRTLVLPQLGAPGVAAHEVQQRCGFRVVYGPVRAADLPAFLAAGMHATSAMRRVTFTAGERLVLTPVEMTSLWKFVLWGSLLLCLLGGIGPQLFSVKAALARGTAAIFAGLGGLGAGAVVVPVLLPWLPGRMFAVKGALAGILAALAGKLLCGAGLGMADSLALFLFIPAVSAWSAMNFTGSTPFTSPSGVAREMRCAIPFQVAGALAAGGCWIAGVFLS